MATSRVCLHRLVLLLVVISHSCDVRSEFPRILECEFYDSEACERDDPDERCDVGTNCDPSEGRPAHCMVQWKNDSSGSIQVTRKGCWGEDERCVGKSGCFDERFSPHTYFCCCDGDRCNSDFSYTPIIGNLPDAYEDTVCEYYDIQKCDDERDKNPHIYPEVCNRTVEICPRPDVGKQVHCYASWENKSSEFVIGKKGCWLDDDFCQKTTCEDIHEGVILAEPSFCCCTGSMCNVDVQQKFIAAPVEDDPDVPSESPFGDNQVLMTLVYSLVPICAITIIILFTFWLWRRQRSSYHEPLPTMDPSPVPPPSPPTTTGLKPIQLLEVKAHGRFGCVWKAQMIDEIVAVKIFPLQDRQSYATEKAIYQLPYFSSHENVLRFIAGEKRGDHLNMELWLITEYHERGSLHDFLKGTLVSWPDAIKISESMTRGLAFIHEEISSHKMCSYKPAVVHRDFKSKNVLIKRDNTASIADFGLALRFDPCSPVGDTHGQVGTRRYMAPEVLEGAINFSRDHFLRIDMYACGLVLWEIISRCSSVDGPVEEYQLPFEDEVGQHPSLEDMQDCVVQRKCRPPFKEQWTNHAGLTSMYQSITECWDTDPEARLSAGCIQERIAQLSVTSSHPTSNQLPPVVMTTNSQTPPKDPMIV